MLVPAQSPLAFRKSMTALLKASGSSMLQACPVPGNTTWRAPLTPAAVAVPPGRELSYAPLITSVGTWRSFSRPLMSQLKRASSSCAIAEGESVCAFSAKIDRIHRPCGVSGKPGATTDEDHRLGDVGVIEPGQERNARPDAAAAKDRGSDAFLAADAEHVVLHVSERIGRLHLVGAAVTSDVHADAAEVGRELRDLVEPK